MDSLSNQSDELLAAHCIRDMNALTELIARYEGKLDAYIRRKSSASNEDRKDILQNVFIKVYKNILDFDKSLPFSSWIYRIAHNETIDWYRREKRRPTLSIDDEDIGQLASDSDTAHLALESETKADIKRAIEALPQKYQEIVELRFFEEKSYEEISDILAIPPGTVAVRINRVKKKLEALLPRHA